LYFLIFINILKFLHKLRKWKRK